MTSKKKLSFRNQFYPFICLAYGLCFIALGIVFICMGEFVLEYIALIGGIIMAINGIYTLLRCFARRAVLQRLGMSNMIITGALNIAVGVVTILLPYIARGFVYIVMALYMLFNSLLNAIDFHVQGKNKAKGRWVSGALAIIFFTFTAVMMLLPEIGQTGLLVVVGVYCILYGTTFVFDCVMQLMPNLKMQRRLRVLAPTFFSVFMPLRVMKKNKIQMYSEPDKMLPKPVTFFPEGKETSVPPDIEVVIHVSDDGVGKMGHCDVYFDGEILSYGAYDVSTITLFGGLGDGVFFTAKRPDYIPFAVRHDHKTLFAYGIRLTPEQKESVRKEVREIKSMLVPWMSPLQAAMQEDPNAKLKDHNDFGSQVWNDTHASFYKFKEGKFKTYFVLTTNCVLLADQIIAPSGIDNVTPNGIMTPGAYFEFLEKQLALKDSMVFCKTVYNRENTADWPAPKPYASE